ncbi:MAG: hypothetical protein C0404_06660 [Verrucomicrobia bacterium]|nr:hypothetical protein [Verrucomicrobiota bacterium]
MFGADGESMSVDKETAVRMVMGSRAKLLGYISTIVRDHAAAEDVLQEVVVILLRKCDQIESCDTIMPWLYTTARLESLSACRKTKRLPQPMDESILDLLDENWIAAEATDEIPVRIDALRVCMDTLNGHNRQLIELRYGGNLSGKDLAKRLNKPLNTIYVALARIHKALGVCVRSTLERQMENSANA